MKPLQAAVPQPSGKSSWPRYTADRLTIEFREQGYARQRQEPHCPLTILNVAFMIVLLVQEAPPSDAELFRAINGADPETVSILLRCGANPNALDDAGLRPLHHAVLRGRADVTALLLSSGADPFAVISSGDFRGRNPADLAMSTGRPDISSLLAEHRRRRKIRLTCTYRGRHSLFESAAASMVIGRKGADLDLSPEKCVSRKQARIWLANGAYWIEDLRSVHGTRVNSEMLRGGQRTQLQPGDMIFLGDTTLRFEGEPAADPPRCE